MPKAPKHGPDHTPNPEDAEAVTSAAPDPADATRVDAESADDPATESAAAADAADSADAEDTEETAVSPISQVPTVVWALFSVLLVIAGLGGYLVGTQTADTTATQAAPTSAQQDSGNAATSEESAVEKLSKEEIAELVAQVKPGTGSLDAESEDGSFDATIYGPGGEIQSVADIMKVARRDAADPFAYGAVDAPVVISEFSDFECPFCSRYANTTEPELIDQYVKDGLVRIEWNDYAINGPHAVNAAQAGRAAAAQGKFFAFKHALYTASKDITGHPEFGREDYIRFAKEAGVEDMDAFTEALDNETYAEPVAEAQRYANGLGIQGTPSFVVGTRFVSGAQPTETFVEVINVELAKVAAGEVSVPQ
ncbi:thioredoxin domain-containing protein [Corynebacterium sp. 11A]|uniref:DsbA family protein n=1 Tax=Corynebacterium sp. 11A TaxID=2080510 RepID=UPI00124E5EFA